AAGELLYCYNIVQPRNVMPVHGEVRHLVANAELAKATGVPRTVVVTDGGVVDLTRGGEARVAGQIEATYIFVDGTSVGDISESSLTDRKILGEEGFISIVCIVDTRAGTIVSGPDVHARGFLEDESIFDGVRGDMVQALLQSMADGVTDSHRLQQVIRRTIGRWVSSRHRRRPMIVPVVIEV